MTRLFLLLGICLFAFAVSSCSAEATDATANESTQTTGQPVQDPTAPPNSTAAPTSTEPAAIEEPTSTPVPATPVPSTPIPPTPAPATPVVASSPRTEQVPTPTPDPTVEPTATPAPTYAPVSTTDHSGLEGTRGLTLQWIGWDSADWGHIKFVPLTDGSYRVVGRQDAPVPIGSDPQFADFVEIDGTIVPVNDRELVFQGTIETKVSYLNGGEPCLRDGEMTFLATGERQYWRLQDQINCEGSTDYVDIYFG